MAKAMKLKQLTFIVPNRVGLLSEVTTFLANGKINIEALCAYGRGEEGVFMIVTDIGALLYVAYVNLFRVLPAAETTQSTIAAAVIGAICLVLIAAALVLIVDAWRAIQRARQAKPVQA